ncbi:hypothetical protein TCAP_06750 [Tolypocladium capitatum]|uniref:Uncharacterized protein n=1 Tax=Tolypocladium capitatum TaxID=45235 RepID=A0A2K3Q736_9HYPO|nr:hypothetical protein TCAP_06750 [Tolypocladium capitatum]
MPYPRCTTCFRAVRRRQGQRTPAANKAHICPHCRHGPPCTPAPMVPLQAPRALDQAPLKISSRWLLTRCAQRPFRARPHASVPLALALPHLAWPKRLSVPSQGPLSCPLIPPSLVLPSNNPINKTQPVCPRSSTGDLCPPLPPPPPPPSSICPSCSRPGRLKLKSRPLVRSVAGCPPPWLCLSPKASSTELPALLDFPTFLCVLGRYLVHCRGFWKPIQLHRRRNSRRPPQRQHRITHYKHARQPESWLPTTTTTHPYRYSPSAPSPLRLGRQIHRQLDPATAQRRSIYTASPRSPKQQQWRPATKRR